MESQITSPVISCWRAVKLQSAPFWPVVPQPRWLALPVHFKKNSLSSALVMATFCSKKVDSVLVV